VIQNKVLRRIFEHKKEEVTQGWRKLHTEVLHNLYSCIILIVARIKWVAHAVGKIKNACKVLTKNLKESGKFGIDGKITLRWILEKMGVNVWNRFKLA
jgi:hypothetical protein